MCLILVASCMWLTLVAPLYVFNPSSFLYVLTLVAPLYVFNPSSLMYVFNPSTPAVCV